METKTRYQVGEVVGEVVVVAIETDKYGVRYLVRGGQIYTESELDDTALRSGMTTDEEDEMDYPDED